MKRSIYFRLIPAYFIVLGMLITSGIIGNMAISSFAEKGTFYGKYTVVIDPGHGGIDGGAVSCTGVYESVINLEIASKLNDLFHLLGIRTLMTREEDISIHTSGNSISEKKISDLKQRVKIVNNTSNAVLISIHQNYFPERVYSGPQVFYANTDGSLELAAQLQTALNTSLAPSSRRKEKAAKDIYLMEKVRSCAILVECGFISNYDEEQKLKSDYYQKKIASVMATSVIKYLNISPLS